MKNISLIAASVLALGGATASAQTTPSKNTTAPSALGTVPPAADDANPTAPPPMAPDPTTPPTTTTMDVNTPPGVSADATVTPVAMPAPVESRPAPEPERRPVFRPWVAEVGGGLFFGGGYQDFTNSGLRGMTGTGGYWSVRFVAGMRHIVGIEAAYVGDARNIDAIGLSSNAHLISNGAEGALRVNIPFVSRNRRSVVEPFGFAGLGWSHYRVTNTNVNTSDVSSNDDIMTVPFGGGLAFGRGGFVADARFTYRKTYYNNLVPGENLDNWGIGGQVGIGF